MKNNQEEVMAVFSFLGIEEGKLVWQFEKYIVAITKDDLSYDIFDESIYKLMDQRPKYRNQKLEVEIGDQRVMASDITNAMNEKITGRKNRRRQIKNWITQSDYAFFYDFNKNKDEKKLTKKRGR